MAAAAFEFVQGTERLDWGVLVAIDLQRLVKDTNVDTLQRIVENLAFARVTRDEAAMFTPEHIIHLFTLCQLVIQYLVCSQESLAKINVKLSDRVQEAQHRSGSAEAERERLHQENVILRRELKSQRRTLLAYEYTKTAVSGGAGLSHVCPQCGDAYVKNESLQSHMRKRHMKPAAVVQPQQLSGGAPMSSPAYEQPVGKVDYEMQQLQAKVDRLEQLLEKEKERNDRLQHNSMMIMQATLVGQRNTVQEQQPSKPTQEQQQQPEKQSQKKEESLAHLPLVHKTIAALPLQESPESIAAVPVMPDIAALQRYNMSRQQESNNNALLRQISELEKAVRDLKKTKNETLDGHTAPSFAAAVNPPAAPPPSSTPSWLAVNAEQPTVKEHVVTPTPVSTIIPPTLTNNALVLRATETSVSCPQQPMQVPHTPASSFTPTALGVSPPSFVQQQQAQPPGLYDSVPSTGMGTVSTISTSTVASHLFKAGVSDVTVPPPSVSSAIASSPVPAPATTTMTPVSVSTTTASPMTNEKLLEKYGPTGPAIVPYNTVKNPHFLPTTAKSTVPTPSPLPEWLRSDSIPDGCSKDESLNATNTSAAGSSDLRATTNVVPPFALGPPPATVSKTASASDGFRPPLAALNIGVPKSYVQSSPAPPNLGDEAKASVNPGVAVTQFSGPPPVYPTPAAEGGTAYGSTPLFTGPVFSYTKDLIVDPERAPSGVTVTSSSSGSSISERSSSIDSSTSS